MNDDEKGKPNQGNVNDEEQTDLPDSPEKEGESRRGSRRKLLTSGGIAAGGAVLGGTGWLKPVVRTVVLPAHAQTSPSPMATMAVTTGGATTTTGGSTTSTTTTSTSTVTTSTATLMVTII